MIDHQLSSRTERNRREGSRDTSTCPHPEIPRRRSLRGMTIVGLLAYVVLGCQSARLGQPVARELAGSDPDAQIEFWHSLNDAPVCSNDQAMHGLLLYFDNKDDTKSYDERVALLKSRKMLPGNFNEPADAAL